MADSNTKDDGNTTGEVKRSIQKYTTEGGGKGRGESTEKDTTNVSLARRRGTAAKYTI